MAFPTEILAGPVNVYIAPTGTAFADVDTAPTSPWVLLGTQGNLNIDEDGVSITDSVDTEEFTPLGDIQAVKSWLTGSDLRVAFNLADISLEALSHGRGEPATAAGNVQTVAAGSGTPGYKWLSLTRSSIPTQVAMLIKSLQSPYDDNNVGWGMQWEINRVAQVAAVPITFVKGVPVKIAFEYRVYRDASGVGRIVAQNATALA